MSRDDLAVLSLMAVGVVLVVAAVLLVHRRERGRVRAARGSARALAGERGWQVTPAAALPDVAYPPAWRAERTRFTGCVQEVAAPGLTAQWWTTRSSTVGGVATATTSGAFLLRVPARVGGKLLVGGVPTRPALGLVPEVFQHHVLSLQRTWLLGDPAVWEQHAATFEAALPDLLAPGRWLVLLEGELGVVQVGSPVGADLPALAGRLAALAGALAARPGSTPEIPRTT